jgi:hypothetical protein
VKSLGINLRTRNVLLVWDRFELLDLFELHATHLQGHQVCVGQVSVIFVEGRVVNGIVFTLGSY